MKSSRVIVISLFVFLLCWGALAAQESAQRYVFGTYYVCDQNREAWSDQVTEKFFGPVYDKHVAEGHLLGWGLMSHNLGGDWRRVVYYASSDLNTLLETRNAIIEESQAQLADASRELTDMCPDHDDYIWASVAGSAPLSEQLKDRTGAGYSTYFVCDPARQDRADEIVQEAFAPALNQLVKDGQLSTWTWFAHVVGGEYRRLMSYTGADHKSLLAAVDAYTAAAGASNPGLGKEFRDICSSHVDYLWDIPIAR